MRTQGLRRCSHAGLYAGRCLCPVFPCLPGPLGCGFFFIPLAASCVSRLSGSDRAGRTCRFCALQRPQPGPVFLLHPACAVQARPCTKLWGEPQGCSTKPCCIFFFLYQHDIRNICFLSMRFCCLLAAVIDKHLCAMLASIKRSPLARIVAGKSTRRME